MSDEFSNGADPGAPTRDEKEPPIEVVFYPEEGPEPDPPGMAVATDLMTPAPPPYPPGYGVPPGGGGNGRRRSRFRTVVIVAACVALILSGYLVDRVFLSKEEIDRKSTEKVPFDLGSQASYRSAVSDIQRYYYHDFDLATISETAEKAVAEAEKGGEKNHAKLLDVGLTALCKALDDKHTSYMTKSENERLTEDLSGSFSGVGFTLQINEDEDRPEVGSVIEGSPAEGAGVKAGDIILKVDDEETKGKTLDAVVSGIRGKSGTRVTILFRRGEKNIKSVITRETIEYPDFKYSMVEGNLGLLELFEFNSGVTKKVEEAIRELQAQGARGFILDLSSNPGGLMNEAISLAGLFLDGGPVVSYRTKGSDARVEEAGGGTVTDLPLVVMIDSGSASSSEIAAGALKDRGRATVIGQTSYGKGSVQKMYDLANGGAIKLTIALYYLPDGESIDGTGIAPEMPVAEVPDDPKTTYNNSLDAAKAALNNLINGRAPTGELPGDDRLAA